MIVVFPGFMMKPLAYYLSYLPPAEVERLERSIRALRTLQELAYIVSLAARVASDPIPVSPSARDELVEKV